jgi:uncharacterized membrane protein
MSDRKETEGTGAARGSNKEKQRPVLSPKGEAAAAAKKARLAKALRENLRRRKAQRSNQEK